MKRHPLQSFFYRYEPLFWLALWFALILVIITSIGGLALGLSFVQPSPEGILPQ